MDTKENNYELHFFQGLSDYLDEIILRMKNVKMLLTSNPQIDLRITKIMCMIVISRKWISWIDCE